MNQQKKVIRRSMGSFLGGSSSDKVTNSDHNEDFDTSEAAIAAGVDMDTSVLLRVLGLFKEGSNHLLMDGHGYRAAVQDLKAKRRGADKD
jgi:hypothetical protein